MIDPDATALANLYDAGAVKVPPWMAVVIALSGARPDSIGASIDWLAANRGALEQAYVDGSTARLGLPLLDPALQHHRELGFLDRGKDDHALRDRYLFADIIHQRTFFQTAVYAMTGVELAPRDAAMLEQLGNANLLVDRRAWPMAVTRRVGGFTRDYNAAVLAGLAMMGTPVLAGAAAADCARFLRRARAAELEGRPVADLVAELVGRRERVMGFGRPLVGPDERVPIIEDLLARYGRGQLPYVTLLRAADDAFFAAKRLRTTAAAWAAAILLDYGLTPEHVHAVSNFWVAVCVYAQAAFSVERGPSAGA